MEKVNLAEKLALFDEPWQPRIVAELNGQHVKLAKIRGPFVWHHHDGEDELFLVVRGSFRMELRDRTIELAEGDMLVVPRGVEHRPVAEQECHILLFEPAGTVNTGSAGGERTVAYEPGHMSYLGYSALHEALRFLDGVGVEAARRHSVRLARRLHERLDPERYRCISPHLDRSPIISFATPDPRALGERLRAADIVISLGKNYFRVSPAIYNTEEDVDLLATVLNRA